MRDLMMDTDEQASEVGRLTEVKFGHLLSLPAEVGFSPEAIGGRLAGEPFGLAQGVASANAYSYGWDTAFAIRLPDVNRAIAKAKSSPSHFNQQAPDGSCSVDGRFSDWEVCGGDSTLLHFRVPISAACFVADGVAYAIDGADAIIEVRLEYLAHAAQPATQQLMLQRAGDNGEPQVSLVDLLLPADSSISRLDPNFLQTALLRSLLNLWFRENLSQFRHVFTAVEINQRIDNDQFRWLAPTHTSYALSRGETPETSVFGVLCMTQGRAASGNAAQISPNAIPGSARAGFLISQERFLEQMVLPGLVQAFPGSKRSDFSLSPDRDRVINMAPIDLKPITHLGVGYQPVLTELDVRVLGDEVIVSSVTRTDIALGTYSEVKVTSFQRLKLAEKPDGSQTMIYEPSRPPLEDHATKSTASGEVLQALIIIALAIVMLVLAILTAGAALIVGLIIVSLLMGLTSAAPQLIADVVSNKVTNDSPSLALLVSSATAPIQWAAGSTFELTELGLGHSLQLGGNPGFA